MTKSNAWLAFWALWIAFTLLAVVVVLFSPSYAKQPLSAVVTDAKAGEIKTVDVEADRFVITRHDGSKYATRRDPGQRIEILLDESGVDRSSIQVRSGSTLLRDAIHLYVNFLPLILGGAIALYFTQRKRFRRPAF